MGSGSLSGRSKGVLESAIGTRCRSVRYGGDSVITPKAVYDFIKAGITGLQWSAKAVKGAVWVVREVKDHREIKWRQAELERERREREPKLWVVGGDGTVVDGGRAAPIGSKKVRV